jgi:hypothetical protein
MNPNNPYSLQNQQKVASGYSATIRAMTAQRQLSTPQFERELEDALQNAAVPGEKDQH